MKIDGGIPFDLSTVAAAAKDLEAFGYDGVWIPEIAHDPFLPLALAAEHTETLEIGTSIAVAFARTPMTLANTAYDLAKFSDGRFILGLGSQIKPHITKRFSMPWSSPAARMREYILALHAIWSSWMNDEKLHFRGDFYQHTLMTPFFNPGPHPGGVPRVFLAGVGPLMTEVAGEVADGFFCHGFTTERYLREVTIPALAAGRDKVGKTMEGFELCGPSFVVTGTNEDEMAAAVAGTKKQIAFYGSTPAYRPVLDLHGWGELQDELNSLSKQGRWDDMTDVITDEVLHAFAVVGEPEEIGPELHRRYGDVISRISFYTPYASDPDRWRAVVDSIKG